jgi:sugar lactone lactonase YvrE
MAPGTIMTYAGVPGTGGYNGHGVLRTKTWLYWPTDVYVKQETGDVYVVDWNNHIIREVFAGTDTFHTVAGGAKLDDGTVNTINHPTNILFTKDNELLIVCWHNHQIRRALSDVNLEILYGTVQGYTGDGGAARRAKLNLPTSAAWGADSTLYVSDEGNRRIRIIKDDGPIRDRTITTFAGSGEQGFDGDGGPCNAPNVKFDCPIGTNSVPGFRLTISDDKHWLYLCDSYNHRIRRIDLVDPQHIITTVAGTGATGQGNGSFGGDGGPALEGHLSFPTDIDLDADGTMYICDTDNNRVRKVDTNGIITTVAGSDGQGYGGDGGQATAAQLNHPSGIALDRAHRVLYIADQNNHAIRAVKLAQ